MGFPFAHWPICMTNFDLEHIGCMQFWLWQINLHVNDSLTNDKKLYIYKEKNTLTIPWLDDSFDFPLLADDACHEYGWW